MNWRLWLFALYFTFPANLFIYGINDVFDYETDKRNWKKGGYEKLLPPKKHKRTLGLNALANIPFFFFLTNDQAALIPFLFFLFLGVFYSSPPIRAKTKPFLDSAFNILYAMPGIFAFHLAGGTDLSAPIIAAAFCWCAAMHAFSAIPDIESDTEAGMRTIATTLGKDGCLAFCTVLYGIAAITAYTVLGSVAIILGVLYLGMMFTAFRTKTASELFTIYTRFPLLNTAAGMLLFFGLLLDRIG